MTKFSNYALSLIVGLTLATPPVFAADLTGTEVAPSTYNKQSRAQRFTETLNKGTVTLDNGLIVKWGTEPIVTAVPYPVVFNSTFPTKMLTVNAQVVEPVSVDAQAVSINTPTVAGFTIRLQCFTLAISCVTGAAVRWTATGY